MILLYCVVAMPVSSAHVLMGPIHLTCQLPDYCGRALWHAYQMRCRHQRVSSAAGLGASAILDSKPLLLVVAQLLPTRRHYAQGYTSHPSVRRAEVINPGPCL